MPEDRDDQSVLDPGAVLAAAFPADLRDRILQPRQRHVPGDVLAELQHRAGLVISQRPRDVCRRRGPERQIEAQPGGALLGLVGLGRAVVLDGPAQHGRPPRLRRALALRQELALDPVGVRVPAFAQEQFGLPLGHHIPGREADRGQAPALPNPGRDTGFVLGGAQRLARRAVAVADHHAAEEITPPVTRASLRFADHRPMEPRR